MRGTSGLRERAEALVEKVEDPGQPPEEPARGPGHVPDARGEGSIWDRVAAVAGIAPVQGDPSLEPADNPWEVAMMAGWGDVDGRGRGHDAMYGVDLMVTGEVDAMDELRVDSATAGSVLQLERSEDLDTAIDPAYELEYEDPYFGDWTTHL